MGKLNVDGTEIQVLQIKSVKSQSGFNGELHMKKKKFTGIVLIAVFTIICLGAAASYIANTKKQDTLKFIKENVSPTNIQHADYEVNIGKNVIGATIIAELWQDGVCTQSTPVVLSNQTNQLHITLLIDGYGTNEGVRSLNIQIDTNEQAGSVLTYFELSSQVRGYSFTAYEDKEVIKVNAGEEQILAAMAFDVGAGIRSMDCTSLLNESERLTSASCLLIVRATFTAEQIPSQKTELAQ